MVCAAQAIDYKKPLKSTPVLEKVHDFIRSKIDHVEEDRIFSDDIEKAIEIIKNGEIPKITHDKEYFHKGEYDELFEVY